MSGRCKVTPLRLVAIIAMTLGLFCLSVTDRSKQPQNKKEAKTLQDPRKLVDSDTLRILGECAEKNISFLKGKISEKSITRFKEYCRKTFRKNTSFLCVLYSFNRSHWAGAPGFWTAEKITRSNCETGTRCLLDWLNKNYTPQSDLTFFYFPMEPYNSGWNMEQKIQDELDELLDSCPLLITCNHPNLVWTKKGILIPDEYVLSTPFYRQMDELLNSKVYPSMHDLNMNLEKGVVRFSERKPIVYFRGSISGPKLPFTMENIQENPRQHALTRLQEFSYLDFKITDFLEWKQEKGSPYLAYLLKNFSHLKSDSVDFFKHAEHKYILSCDGFGAAWVRVQRIMATGSVLFLNAQCKQYFYSLMENNKTHVEINKNFSNLDVEFKRLERDLACAEKIGKQGQEFARKFFSKPAVDTYLWLVLNKLESYSS